MNKFRYMILAMAAILSFAVISCSPKENYAPGKPDLEDCFGVYFPSQDAGSGTIMIEPTDAHTVKVSIAREFSDVDYDVEVPFELTGDDIFEIDPIVFEGGVVNTSFYVNFDGAELGKEYSCTIEVNDPQFVSNYRTKANYITLSVVVVSWDELGEGTYVDYAFTNSVTGEPLAVQTKIYRNSNDKNLYRVDDPFSEFMAGAGALSSTRVPEYFQFRVLERNQEFEAYEGSGVVTIPVEDLVFYQPIFTGYADGSYGDAYYYHPSLLMGYEDPMTWYDNRVINWQNAAKTLPGVVQLAPSLYFPSAGGYPPAVCANIVFPGAKLTDYTMSISTGLSENGQVPMKVSLGDDVKEVKYAVFSGELSEDKITEKVDGIIAGKVACESITAAGDYNITGLTTSGIYTLVAVAYDNAGNNVNYTSLTFGFLKAGETNPVNISCGVIVSDKYAPEGYTSENSLEFYIYGENIKKAHYGLYRKKDFEEKYESVILDLKSYDASKAELEAINGTGLTDLFIRLNSGMEYVLVVCASNGYEEKIISASAKLGGELNPLQMTYDLDMLAPASEKADYCREWIFWSGTPQSNGRVEVGPVTITDGGNEMVEVKNEDGSTSEMEVEYLKVKGFWKPVVDEGYLKNDEMKWQYYGGAIVPLHGKVGEWRNQSGELLSLEMISFFSSGQGGYPDGAVCGAFTDEGNIAFVDMETGAYDDFGSYWFTAMGVFDSKGNYQGEMISYDEMMFIDPANQPSSNKTSAAEAMLNEVKVNFQKRYNFVEYKHFQVLKAIDSVFGQVQVRSFGEKAGLEIEAEHAQVKCSLQPSGKSSGIISLGKPGTVSLRK